jgi:putative toxin-antitoxin system antitoxin component (TIGR02293 family)
MVASRASSAVASKQLSGSLGLPWGDVLVLVNKLKSGLPFATLLEFSETSRLTLAEIAQVLLIPPRTLARRKAGGMLSSPESERLVRLASLFDKAVHLFEGDDVAAVNWLRTPNKALGNQSPLLLAESEVGARAVEDLIGRLEYGVYS